jgi:hypothetical protein
VKLIEAIMLAEGRTQAMIARRTGGKIRQSRLSNIIAGKKASKRTSFYTSIRRALSRTKS